MPFPERDLDPAALERARQRRTRQDILEATYAGCRAVYVSDAGREAREYMASRGFTEADAEALGVGLYPANVEQLRQQLLEQGLDPADVQGAGVLFRRLGGYVVFPWRDDRGTALTLYGTWPARKPPPETPKKMALPNPKDQHGNEIEHTKRSPLYLDRALAAGVLDLVVVEGLTDAALLQVRGEAGAIAPVAADLSADMIQTLARNRVSSVTLCLDPDGAGENATARNIHHLTAAGISVYVAPTLPEGLDPDDYVAQHGIEAWRKHLAGKVAGYRWLAERVVAGAESVRPETTVGPTASFEQQPSRPCKCHRWSWSCTTSLPSRRQPGSVCRRCWSGSAAARPATRTTARPARNQRHGSGMISDPSLRPNSTSWTVSPNGSSPVSWCRSSRWW